MPDYIHNVLIWLKHPLSLRKWHSPHARTNPIYCDTQRFAPQEDNSENLPHSRILLVQQIVCSLLYYEVAVDCTILFELGDLAFAQTTAREDTWDAIV